MRTLLLATLPLGLALSAVAEDAKPFTLRSGPKQIPLIELFTSEGCSSCPPAEKWLGELTDTPGLWRDFVPVAWHVDYWDGLGWPDRFASKANTQRQELYAAGWRTPSIYTPGFVLDGAEWRGWGRSLDLGKSAKADAGTFELKATGADQFTVTFTRPAGTEGDFTATLAWLGNGLVSEVRRGENAGRKLRHNFIVLGSATTKLTPHDGQATGILKLPHPHERDSAKLAVAAWVSRSGGPAPVQAVGGWWTAKE